MTEPIITVRNLSLESGEPILRDISFQLQKGKVLGIVGESGSGKTLLVKSILGVLPKTVRKTSGTVELFGVDAATLDPRAWRSLWTHRFGAVFQDPGSYLNPSYTVLAHFDEFYRVALKTPRAQRRTKALEALAAVNIRDAELVLTRYRHELSGGTLQRIVLALALARSPEVLIADEATTSLDVTIEAEVLDLLSDLRDRGNMSIVVVSHDLSVVSRLADDIIVLRNGSIVEAGPTQRLLAAPRSDYLRLLIDSYTKYGVDRIAPAPHAVSAG